MHGYVILPAVYSRHYQQYARKVFAPCPLVNITGDISLYGAHVFLRRQDPAKRDFYRGPMPEHDAHSPSFGIRFGRIMLGWSNATL